MRQSPGRPAEAPVMSPPACAHAKDALTCKMIMRPACVSVGASRRSVGRSGSLRPWQTMRAFASSGAASGFCDLRAALRSLYTRSP